MMSTISRLALVFAAALGACAAIAHLPQPSTAPSRQATAPTAQIDPADVLQARIAADYKLASSVAPFAATEYPAIDLRRLIRDRIAPELLDGALSVRGSDYRFTPGDGGRRHVGLVVIRYGDATTAGARIRPLLGDRRVFRGTVIYTPMVVAARGATIVVFFTESGGDAKLRAALVGAAAQFQGS